MMQPVILTTSGGYFNFENPDPASINIHDIAHALSHLCRFTGHTGGFYSVAQHSVMVSRLSSKKLALEGLLHDASEAYLGDVSSPLKALLPDYRRIEDNVQLAIAHAFDLDYPFSLNIHYADMVALATERRDLMPVAKAGLQEMDQALWAQVNRYPADEEKIVPLPPDAAKAQFLARYEEVCKSLRQ